MDKSKTGYNRDYTSLRLYGLISFIAGIIVIIAGVISLFAGYGSTSIFIIIMGIPMLALHNLIGLLINMENDSHESANYLRQLVHGKDKEVKLPHASKTGYVCTKCGEEVKDQDNKCKKCKSFLAVDGAVKKVDLK